jgi:PHP family Zn ribbon phosphoesterase
MALATDQGLAGHALAAEVDKLVRLGLKAPHDFWEKLMSERSQTIMANSNRHSREKKALEQRQQQLQVCEDCRLHLSLCLHCQPELDAL